MNASFDRQALRIFVCPKRKSDRWRSERTPRTTKIVLRCATSRIKDRRCDKLNSCLKIGQATREKIFDFSERPREEQWPRSMKRNSIEEIHSTSVEQMPSEAKQMKKRCGTFLQANPTRKRSISVGFHLHSRGSPIGSIEWSRE